MATIEATFRTIPGTQAAEGHSGGHRVVVDRPAGVAGGRGSGLNGGQLLALAIGGCLANDVRYVAAEREIDIEDIEVDVDVTVDNGTVSSAAVKIGIAASDQVDSDALAREAVSVSTVVSALREGFPISIR